MTAAAIRKTLVSLAGALASIVALGVLPDPWDTWLPMALAVLTALGVYAVPNTPQQLPAGKAPLAAP
jgi:hypothetical protein